MEQIRNNEVVNYNSKNLQEYVKNKTLEFY